MIAPLFAWSWDGHGNLTTLALAAAIAQLIRLGKSDLMKRFFRLYRALPQMPSDPMRKPNLYENVDRDPTPPNVQMQSALQFLFRELPGIVQRTDLHVGNIPWGVGEFLDSNGQVRHFMRSTSQTTETEAYTASMGWIRNHLTESFERLRAALYTNYGFFDHLLSSNTGDFRSGVTALAEGLHTVEDAYAPGHVRRDQSLHNLITGIYYWDDDNKTAHGDWPGHEALDNPENPISRPYFQSALDTTTEIIVCVLSNLDSDATFGPDLRRKLDNRFHLMLGGRVLPPYYLTPSAEVPV
jgi:hypothetical protein